MCIGLCHDGSQVLTFNGVNSLVQEVLLGRGGGGGGGGEERVGERRRGYDWGAPLPEQGHVCCLIFIRYIVIVYSLSCM